MPFARVESVELGSCSPGNEEEENKFREVKMSGKNVQKKERRKKAGVINRRTAVWAIVMVLASGFSNFPLAWGKDYPNKPIQMITPYGPGGESDLAARALASVVPEYLGQPLIVINRGGAGGALACSAVAQAKADGYTLLLARTGSNAIFPALNPKAPFQYDAFTPMALLQVDPNVMAVRADSPYKTIQDLIQGLRAKPGQLRYSTSGPGTVLNLGVQITFKEAGLPKTSATMIPFDSGGKAVTALLGGHVDFLFVNTPPVIGHVMAGKLRALAVTTPQRLKDFPDVPTFAEVGFPKVDLVGWSAIFGPKNLPGEVMEKWEQALQKVFKNPSWLAMVENQHSVPTYLNPKGMKEYLDQEYQRYYVLGRELDILIK